LITLFGRLTDLPLQLQYVLPSLVAESSTAYRRTKRSHSGEFAVVESADDASVVLAESSKPQQIASATSSQTPTNPNSKLASDNVGKNPAATDSNQVQPSNQGVSTQNGQNSAPQLASFQGAASSMPIDALTPDSITLEDWSTGRAVIVGSAKLSKSLAPIVWEDQQLRSEMGDIQVRGVAASIQWKSFEFGAIHLWSPTAAEGNRALHQILVGAKPTGRWATYPYSDTFNAAQDLTIPPAFKVKITSVGGQVLHTHQMRDGKPINDPALSQTRAAGTGALRPFWNIGMMLPWSSGKTQLSTNAKNYFPGFKSFPETRGKLSYSSNGAIPLLASGANGRNQINGLNQWHAMPRWPLGFDEVDAPTLDPYGFGLAKARLRAPLGQLVGIMSLVRLAGTIGTLVPVVCDLIAL
jgi:hypothetical protein